MDKSNKYLFTIRSLTGGGAERVVSVLASGMARAGYDISVIAYDKTVHDYRMDPAVKIYYMPKPRGGVLGKINRISDMKKIITQINPDVVIPFVGTVLFVTYLASRHLRCSFVRTVRISPWQEQQSRLHGLALKYINNKANCIMVQNSEQSTYFSKKLQNKIYVVPNPIDEIFISTHKQKYSNKFVNIVTAGRLTTQKNHALLIKVFKNITDKYPEVILNIYGNGPEKANLQKLIASLKMEKKCFLRERTDNIIDVLLSADLFVMTSDFEGMPNALMEALAVGVPCISSDCKTGPRDLIKHKETGLLFETGNPKSLEENLSWALQHTLEMNDMAKHGREHILKYHIPSRVIEDMEFMLKQLPDYPKKIKELSQDE